MKSLGRPKVSFDPQQHVPLLNILKFSRESFEYQDHIFEREYYTLILREPPPHPVVFQLTICLSVSPHQDILDSAFFHYPSPP